jgi:hypothetical protein
MPPATRTEREEERRLNTRTLAIASVASASAAAVTSQLWIAGTWIAAALTPVLVTLISEAMHRPTERIARAWTSDQSEARSTRTVSTTRTEPTAVTGTPGPVRVYRQAGPRTTLTRRRVAIGTVAATAAIAFVIGLAALTTADLVSGGSVGKGSGRLTLGGGGGGSERNGDAQTPAQDSAPQREDESEQPRSTPAEEPETTAPPEEEPPSDTAPVPPPAETPPGEPAPDATP